MAVSPLVRYFTGERNESFLFLFLGIIGLFLSVYLIFSLKEKFWIGLAIPVILVSLLEIMVGTTLIIRSPKDIVRVQAYLHTEKIKTEEIPRMEKVMRNFIVFRYGEIFLMVAGLFLMFGFPLQEFRTGIGLGLFSQAGIVLILDFFAERRGKEYLKFLFSISDSF